MKIKFIFTIFILFLFIVPIIIYYNLDHVEKDVVSTIYYEITISSNKTDIPFTIFMPFLFINNISFNLNNLSRAGNISLCLINIIYENHKFNNNTALKICGTNYGRISFDGVMKKFKSHETFFSLKELDGNNTYFIYCGSNITTPIYFSFYTEINFYLEDYYSLGTFSHDTVLLNGWNEIELNYNNSHDGNPWY
jgi:hypothetical protein